MNELIQSLQEKIGLTSEQANGAVNHIMEYIKGRIPASLHEHLDAAAIGHNLESLKAKGAEYLAQAQTGGSELLHSVQDKLNSFLNSKEA
jgi:hypothetical protein